MQDLGILYCTIIYRTFMGFKYGTDNVFVFIHLLYTGQMHFGI